jgi:5-methylcytosine-specific restriction protein B
MMDMALRRRFNFVEIAPNSDHVPEVVQDVEVRGIFEILNKKISALLSRDFQIGHSYFMNGKAIDIQSLKRTWFGSVLPLLNEYFYDEPKKLKALVAPFLSDAETIEIEGFEYLMDEQSVEFIKTEDMDDLEFVEAMGKLSNGK